MYWLSRPPYLRYLGAALLVAAGLAIEFAPDTSVDHPFLIRPVTAGETIDDTAVVWRPVPAGLFPPVELPLVATRPLPEGVPVLASLAAPTETDVPPGWFGLELPTPPGALPGQEVLVVTPDRSVEGLTVSPPGEDTFGGSTALVAVPGSEAPHVAAAAMEGRVAVLVGSTDR